MKPLISVIVPVYNGEAYLEKCIRSIVNQTYPQLEILIINDGSTDGTAEVCCRLKEQYPQVQVITMADEGVSMARNAGIAAARGELLTFVDADDRLSLGMLQLLLDTMEETGCDICGCRFRMWQQEEEWEQSQKTADADTGRAYDKQIYDKQKYLKEEILKGNSRCWSKLYRRSVIGNLRFRKNLSIGEDMLFLVELLVAAEKIVEVDYPGYGYYRNPAGAMNRPFEEKYMDQITCWELAREKICEIADSGNTGRENTGKESWEENREENGEADVEAGREEEQYGQLYSQATALLLTSLMLTAGKIALLSGKQRKEVRHCITECHQKVKKELTVSGACKWLSGGYQLKTRLFALAPELYLWIYHFRKYVR